VGASPGGLVCLGAIHFSRLVRVFAMSHLDDQDEENLVADMIDNAVVLSRPDVDAIELLLGFHLFESERARVLLQAENVAVHLLADVRVELADVPLGGGRDFNTIGQT
jgi:hypothetical protein